jgi:hypothetical protein
MTMHSAMPVFTHPKPIGDHVDTIRIPIMRQATGVSTLVHGLRYATLSVGAAVYPQR